MEAGLFDPEAGQKFLSLAAEVSAEADSTEAVRDSLILLQNDRGTLPIPAGSQKVLLVGPFATPAFSHAISAADSQVTVTTMEGCSVSGKNDSQIAAAVVAAKSADVVILCLGSTAALEHEYHDRSNSTLPGLQTQLARSILSAIPTTTRAVAVLNARGSLSVDALKTSCPAIMLSWDHSSVKAHHSVSPNASTSVAEALWGVFSPAGKLPYTVSGYLPPLR